ncbi:MAG: ParB N-terminal domain-containing protein [Leptonema sp. (in: Bacteria)]|nr:ParB N-terminal domain-containing protein [Leptonema sp. (in: bacteria)]
MQIRIRDIHIPKRIRDQRVALDDLVESLSEFGLLQPIIVDTENQLIAGFRRLQAARALGWDSIDTRIIEIKTKRDRLLIEIEENSVRRNFDSGELERARRLVKRYEKEDLASRAWVWIVDLFERFTGRS